jgi:hypothetical protein
VERNADTTAPEKIARLAWLFAFVLPLILTFLLLSLKSAEAASPSPIAVPFAFEEEELEEEDEGEFAEAECEIAHEELEEGLLPEADVEELCAEAEEAAGGGASRAAKCPIRSVRAHAVQRNDRLKLTIGYTTNTATNATVQIRGVGTFKRRLGKSGVLRFSKRTGRKLPHKRIRIRIKLPSRSAGCPSRRLVLFPR